MNKQESVMTQESHCDLKVYDLRTTNSRWHADFCWCQIHYNIKHYTVILNISIMDRDIKKIFIDLFSTETNNDRPNEGHIQSDVCLWCVLYRTGRWKQTHKPSAVLPAAVVPRVLSHFRRAFLVLVISSFLPVIVPGVPAVCSTILVVGLSFWAPLYRVAAESWVTTEGFPEVALRPLVLISFFVSRTEIKPAKQTTVSFFFLIDECMKYFQKSNHHNPTETTSTKIEEHWRLVSLIVLKHTCDTLQSKTGYLTWKKNVGDLTGW